MGRPSEFWAGRRVFVTAAASLLGRELVVMLVARQARVVVLLGRTDAAEFGPRVVVARGRVDDHARLTTALVLHDIQTVFHLADTGLTAVKHAARLANVPVIVPPVAATDPVGDLLWRAEALAAPAAVAVG